MCLLCPFNPVRPLVCLPLFCDVIAYCHCWFKQCIIYNKSLLPGILIQPLLKGEVLAQQIACGMFFYVALIVKVWPRQGPYVGPMTLKAGLHRLSPANLNDGLSPICLSDGLHWPSSANLSNDLSPVSLTDRLAPMIVHDELSLNCRLC